MANDSLMVGVACVFVLLVLSGSLGGPNALHPEPSPSVSPTPTPYHTPTPTPFPTQTPIPTNFPTPTPSPNAPNLADIPADWSLTYGSGPQIIALDYSVTHNGNPSIRLDPHTSSDVNSGREVNGRWITIRPGDHVLARCWIKTTDSSFGDSNPYSGGRFGFDFYGANGRITAKHSTGNSFTPNENEVGIIVNYVHWGSDWVQRAIEFVVPDVMYADGNLADNGAQGYARGSLVVPNRIVMWLQVWSSTYGAADGGRGYFADAEFYINP